MAKSLKPLITGSGTHPHFKVRKACAQEMPPHRFGEFKRGEIPLSGGYQGGVPLGKRCLCKISSGDRGVPLAKREF